VGADVTDAMGRPAPNGLLGIHVNGHFPAWEEPELFAAELRAAYKSLR
jgi:pimeloyl-ACP methyl ester carboxylesterase